MEGHVCLLEFYRRKGKSFTYSYRVSILPCKDKISKLMKKFLCLEQYRPNGFTETTPFGIINNEYMLRETNFFIEERIFRFLTFEESKTIE